MDIERLDSSDEHSENSNEDSIENNTGEWKISYYEEKNFWNKALYNK